MFLVSFLGFCSCDTAVSSISVFSPTDGATYHTDNVDLLVEVFQVNLDSAAITYTLDNVKYSLESYQSHGGHEIRVGETTLSKLSEGEHIIVVRATGTFFAYAPPYTQEMVPVTVHFFVNLTQTPVPTQTPTPTTPTLTQANPNFPLNQSSLTAIGIGAVIVAVTAVSLIYLKKHRKTANLKQ
jgi:hypothetical protein